MIKTIDEITIGDFDKMERTGKVSQYKCWYNVLPLFLFKKRIEKLAIEIDKFINENELSKNILDIEWKTSSLLTINKLEAAYDIAYLNLVTRVELDLLLSKTQLTRRQRRKTKQPVNTLPIALDVIKQIYGIAPEQGKELEFLERVRKEVVRRKDKYNENFKEDEVKNKSNKKSYIIDIVAGYLGYYSQSTKGATRITMIEFKALRDNVDKDIKAKNKQIENQKK